MSLPRPFDEHLVSDIPEDDAAARLPDISEFEAVRHFTRLSRLNHGIDAGMYPLGSCTMKYNPRISEEIARSVQSIHPADRCAMETVLGWLMDFRDILLEICGMDEACLWPAAGAHGELTGMLVIREAVRSKGPMRSKVLVPDTAHGTNPASCAMAGFTAVNIPSGPEGYLRAGDLGEHLDEDVAALMITNPNTLGVFEREIGAISEMLHANGSHLYMDGANLNAVMGVARPGDMGVDCMHVNLHKTFGAPHGGGGPGSGPVLVRKGLARFLPVPRLARDDQGRVRLERDAPGSIGRIHGCLGNVAVVLKACAYALGLGGDGLREASVLACLKANLLRSRMENVFGRVCPSDTLHEFVVSDRVFRDRGVTALDFAKALLDHALHPPTVYFPLNVQGAIMIEPAESEPLRELERFAGAMEDIAEAARRSPEDLHRSPENTPVERVDEVMAARNLILTWDEVNPSSKDGCLNG
jgi:glycine dehydrogenase subunit 2